MWIFDISTQITNFGSKFRSGIPVLNPDHEFWFSILCDTAISTLRAIQIKLQIQIKNSGSRSYEGIEVRIFGSHFLGKSISEEFWPFDFGVTSWHWFPDCQHFLAGLTPRRVSGTRRWWAQTCGLTLTDSERGYLPIMQLPFHPSFQFCDITVLKWLLWEKISAAPPTMGIFHMKVTSSFCVFILWKRYFV